MQVVLTILASIFIFGLIILVHEFGHFITAKMSGVRVLEFALGMGPILFKWKRGDTVYALKLLPIGGSCTMQGEDEDDEDADEEGSFNKAPVGNRILIIVAGAIMNLLLGFVVLIIMVSTQSDLIATRTIHSFEEDIAISNKTGLQEGDTILAINGRNMFVYDDIVYELVRAKDYKADILVERDGEKVTLEDVAFPTYYDEQTDTEVMMRDFYVYGQEKTFGSVLKESALETVSMARLIFVSLIDLITGRVPLNQLSGPVGIVGIINQATGIGFHMVLYILAVITINLGVVNLLPLPALDGGRLVFLLFEAITKKRLNPKYEGYIHAIGLILLLVLMLFVTFNDITALFRR